MAAWSPEPTLAGGAGNRVAVARTNDEHAMRLNALTWRPGQLQPVICLIATLFLSLTIPSEAASSKRASMVIDANTGTTLHASQADELRHPASLTKLMTLYLLFEEIEQGRLRLDSTIRMTKWGTLAPPSKLGLEEGEEISVRDAIRALVTKSANDVARAIAEHIGGTEAGFAKMMTEKARLLGMSRTTFRNASGLPDVEQVTTARDMLTLALHLQDDFPQHYHFFSTRVFEHRGRTYRNHNGLLRTYPGTDGIKTGYIRMSGFNVVTSLRRGDRHVVGVVFGGKTAASRNAEMRALLDRTIRNASTKKTRRPAPVTFYRATPPKPAERRATEPPVAAAKGPQPPMTASVLPALPTSRVNPAAAPGAPSSAPTIDIAKVRHVSIAPAADRAIDQPARAAPRTTDAPRVQPTEVVLGRAPSTLQEQADSMERSSPAAARLAFTDPSNYPTPAIEREPVAAAAQSMPTEQPRQAQPVAARSAPSKPATAAGYHVQVGAYASPAEAEKALVTALEHASGVLAEAAPLTMPVKSGARQLYRARFAGFDSSAARSACEELRRRQIDCFVVKAD